MAYTQKDLDELQKAIASGATKVVLGDRSMSFRSIDDMERLEAKIEKKLNGSASSKPRQVRMSTRKGL